MIPLSGSDAALQSDLKLALQIDAVCDAFEEEWKAGGRPDIGLYLNVKNLPEDKLFVELVLIDFAYRQSAGEEPKFEEYAVRFPHLREALQGIQNDANSGKSESELADAANASTFVGKFELVKRLGGGTFGIVWKARDHQLHRWTALKQFREEYSDLSRRLLTREAAAVAQIDHPNVVRVYEAGQIAGRNYVAFEYVPGGTLAEWIKKQHATPDGKIRIPATKAAEIALQLTQGLAAVHACDVIHRDFKPGNILLDEQGTLKIADFGLARHSNLLATIGGDGVMMGTVPYMSPEQCRGKEVSKQSDLYSLGVILYELLTGERPFQGTQVEILERIQNQQPIPPGNLAEVPDSLENICLRALEKDPADRYESVLSMQADLEAFLRGENVTRHAPPLFKRIRRAIERTWLTTLSVGAILMALGALGYSSLETPEQKLAQEPTKLVTLKSVPSGAKVAFIPLHPQTGIPLPEQIIHAQGTTPVVERLMPGDYLVEVYMDEEGGDFHEVYRRVPLDSENLSTYHAFHGWKRNSDDPNQIELRPVFIPSASVVDDMVFVSGSDHFAAGKNEVGPTPLHTRSVPSFYMDATEVPFSVYQSVFKRPNNPDSRWQAPPTPDHAITSNWFSAIWLLENLGKRLPDEFEFEYAATKGGTQRFPWGDEPLQMKPETGVFPPVGFPKEDRVEYGAPIFGLGSNVAEWTMTRTNALYPPVESLFQSALADLNLRVVRGGGKDVFKGNPTLDAEQRDPRSRHSVLLNECFPGVGFRGVRSTKPRLKPEDFGRPVDQP